MVASHLHIGDRGAAVREFRLLGPFEMLGGAGPVHRLAHKPRTLLALMLLHVGQLVTWERMIEELWDGSPPPSAVPNLRTYATDLRRLVFGGGHHLVADRAGYRLRLDSEVVDLTEFERLCARARRGHEAGDLPTAVTAYAQAVRLWRGQPLAGLRHGPVLSAAATALEERLVWVVEEWFDVRLDLFEADRRGDPDLVAELRRHVVENPLRERPWRQLAVALYRLDDVAGALDACTAARLAVNEALGLDPDIRLDRLHSAVLRRDPSLLRAGAQHATGMGGTVPAHPVPAPVGMARRMQVAVCGPNRCTRTELALAERVGRLLARRHAVVVCAGDQGVAEAVAAGVREEGGEVVGLRAEPAPVPSCNLALVWSADALIAVGGCWDVLSDIAMAVQRGTVPVVALGGWTVLDGAGRPVTGVLSADCPEDAVAFALSPR